MAAGVPAPVSFRPVEGWEQAQVDLDEKLLDNNVVVWTTNVGLSVGSLRGPRDVGPQLPPHGIVVFVSTALTVDDPDSFPARDLPLRLRDGYFVADSYQGQPAPHVSTTLIYAYANGRYVFVQVYYGTNSPSEEMFAEADRQVAGLFL